MSDLLLMSGGLDSIALAAWKKPELCLTIDYGQRAAKAETQASIQICHSLNLRHKVLELDIRMLGSGIMQGKTASPHSSASEFWPFRNQFLVTIAAMTAMNEGYDNILIGTVATDDRHIDGSPNFVKSLNSLVSMQEGNLSLSAPAQGMTTKELIIKSGVQDSVLAWAHSCHTGNLACGRCPGCNKHSQVLHSLGWSR